MNARACVTPRRRHAGFTLVESLVALALLNSGLALTLGLIVHSVGERARDSEILRAQRLLATLRAELELAGPAGAVRSRFDAWSTQLTSALPDARAQLTESGSEQRYVVALEWSGGMRRATVYAATPALP